jgi:hypothetical protein
MGNDGGDIFIKVADHQVQLRECNFHRQDRATKQKSPGCAVNGLSPGQSYGIGLKQYAYGQADQVGIKGDAVVGSGIQESIV